MAELTTDNVLRRDIPWETYMTTKLITGTGLQLLRRYDKKDSSKAQLLDDDGPSYIRVFVSILRDISKEETVEYVLALIDEMLTANPNRARLFHDKSLSNEDTYEPFLKLLLKSNWFIQEKSCKILSLIVSARPKVQNGYSANGDYSDSKKKLTTIDDVLNGLVQWLCAQLKKPSHPTRGTPTAVHCLATLLKEPFVRSSFVQADGVKLLAPSITAASIQQSMQHLYETCLCIWLLSYYVPAVENLATVKVDGKTVLQKLIDVVKGSTKERVVRVVVLTLRNLLDKGNFGAQMADLDVLQVVQSLKSQAWSDEDLLESLNQLEVGLKENIKQLSSFDKYKQEVLLGNLKWSPMHKDPAFWRENITSFEDSDFQILKCDRGKRTVINVLGDDETLAKSDLLTREEVLRRRLRRVKNLSKIYRDMYWTYMEELKVKHREYYWVYGKSPFQEEDESSKGENGEATFQDNGDQGNRCGVHGCKSKAMALTKFCQMHILSDSHQKLYKPCNFAIKSSQTGPILCGKPILRSTVPSYCTLHFQKAEKDVAKALKKAGLSVSATTKLAPKFHVVVSEYVRQIQTKRKEARKREIARTINDVEEDISC